MDKVIMHVDMDAFFASVEVMDNPKLMGKPVIVGGTTERGVVATCSYEARKYGIRSAMPVFMAKARCPEGIFLPVRHERYKEISNKIFKIFYEVTPYVEPLSIDEAYLDITGINRPPADVAKEIKRSIKEKTGLNVSVGISYNKFLAKLASDWNKPNGLKLISKEMVPECLFPLKIQKVYGLGEKSVKKLNDIGVFTIEELYRLPKQLLIEFLGKYGMEIYDRIRGIDKREVETVRERKSVGRETTLKADTDDKSELKIYIEKFAVSISNTMINKKVRGKTVTIKMKTAAFVNHTKSRTLNYYIFNKDDIYKEACSILDEIKLNEKVRLIGVSVSNFKETKIEQLTMFE